MYEIISDKFGSLGSASSFKKAKQLAQYNKNLEPKEKITIWANKGQVFEVSNISNH